MQRGSPAATTSRDAPVARVGRAAVWWIAMIALGMIALVALDRTAHLLAPLLSGDVRPWGRSGIALVGAYVIVALAVTWAVWRIARSSRVGSIGLVVGLVALTVAVRAAMALVADAPIYGENRIIHSQALAVLDGACCFSHRPMGYPIMLAGAYAVLGIGPSAVEALNLGFAAITAWLVWGIAHAGWGRPTAAVATAIFALTPSQLILVLVPLTEPLYTMVVVAVVRLATAAGSASFWIAALTGVAIAIGQYVRATAIALLAPVLLLPILDGAPARAWITRGLTTLAVGFGLLLPVAAYNLEAHGDLSFSTSAYGGWSLFVGANREHDGRWNAEDAARFATFPGDSAWERSEYAGSLADDRVLEDPAGALALLPRKFEVMWASEDYAAAYALADGPATREIRVWWLASQLGYSALVLLATVGMFTERMRPRPATLLIGMIVALVAVTHLAVEVHGRYHAYLVPLLGILAGVGLTTVAAAWGRRLGW